MEKAEAFENNEQLSSISDCSASPTIISNNLSTSSNSNTPSPSPQMPRPIHYSRLSHPPDNLCRSITPDMPLPGMHEYYLTSVSTTPQRMNPELEDLADSIPYAIPPLFPENVIENNEDIFFIRGSTIPARSG